MPSILVQDLAAFADKANVMRAVLIALTLVLIGAWAFYVKRLGGVIRYLNRPFPSIAVLGIAVLVGLLAFYAPLSLKHYPTTEEIRKAPSWEEMKRFYQTGESPDDNKTYDQSVGVIRDDEDKKPDTTPLYNPIAPKTEKGRVVVMDANAVWREKLQRQRDNAMIEARTFGIAAGLIAAAVGYVVLGASLGSRREAEPLPQPAPAVVPPEVAAPPAAAYTDSDLRYEEGPPPREPGKPPPLPKRVPSADEAPYEPYEAPIDISELDKGYEQTKRDQKKG